MFPHVAYILFQSQRDALQHNVRHTALQLVERGFPRCVHKSCPKCAHEGAKLRPQRILSKSEAVTQTQNTLKKRATICSASCGKWSSTICTRILIRNCPFGRSQTQHLNDFFKILRPWHRNNLLGDPWLHSFHQGKSLHFNDLLHDSRNGLVDQLLPCAL